MIPEILFLVEADGVDLSATCESGIDSDMGSSGGGDSDCMCDLEG